MVASLRMSFSQTLLGLLPPPEAPFEAYPTAFRQMAALLLNGATLRVAGQPHRFTEIEFYVNGHHHTDTFTHGDEMQKKGGYWYFHRTAGQYRSGTYKGLDIAIGNAQLFGGILIRGIEQLAPQPKLLDGPCVCVDHMLALNASPSIEQLVSRFDVRIDGPESPLHIELLDTPRAAPILETARVGLTLKRSASVARQTYIAQPYRFLSEPRAIKKGKQHMVVTLHRLGKSVAEIVALSGVPKASAQRYVDAFEAGKSKQAEDYRGDLSSEQVCEMFGLCDKYVVAPAPFAAGASTAVPAAAPTPAAAPAAATPPQLSLGLGDSLPSPRKYRCAPFPAPYLHNDLLRFLWPHPPAP